MVDVDVKGRGCLNDDVEDNIYYIVGSPISSHTCSLKIELLLQ